MINITKAKVLRTLKSVAKGANLYGPLSRVRYKFGDYQKELQAEKELYAPFVKQGQLVFDVGANVGRKSQAFLELGARVVSFEPQPSCANEIKERCGSPEVLRVHTCAIGAEETTEQLDVSNRSGLARIASSTEASQTITVDMYPLDQFVAKYGVPSFCKIDVEGYELEVLKGLSSIPNALSFEYHATSLQEVERARACLDHIRGYGRSVELNYTRRTDTSIQLDSWKTVDEFEQYLCSNWRQMPEFGDLFVRCT